MNYLLYRLYYFYFIFYYYYIILLYYYYYYIIYYFRGGKFNLEPGILPRTLDMYSFDCFGIEGKTINASFNEITDYESPRARKKELTLTKKEGKVDRGEGSIPFNLNSDDDFPALSL